MALPVAAAALVAMLAVAAVQLLAPSAPATRSELAAAVAADLRCPDCQGLSVAESRTAAATAIRAEIDAQLAAGRSPDQVRDHFAQRYGDWILLSPRTPLPWLLPLAALVAGLVAFGWWLRRGKVRRSGSAEPSGPVSETDLRRVNDEAEALDA